MKSLFFAAASLLLTGLFYLFWWNTPLLRQLDYKIYDRLSADFPSSRTPNSTVVIEIDDKSLKAFGQWPWPRVITAELINRIADANPSAVVLDIVFSEKDRSSPDTLQTFYQDFFDLDIRVKGIPEPLLNNDQILSDALTQSTTILPVFSDISMHPKECLLPPSRIQDQRVETAQLEIIDAMVCSLPIYQQHSKGIGHIHAVADNDGTLRRLSMFMRHHDELIPTLGMAAVSSQNLSISTHPISSLKGDFEVNVGKNRFSADQRANVLLTFYPFEQYEKISAYDLFSGTIDPKRLENKFVFVGTTALGLDTWHTIGNGTTLPGVYLHATMVENLLNGDLMVQPSLYPSLNILLSFFISVILLVLMVRKRYLSILLSFAVLFAISFGTTYIAWQHNIYISIGYFQLPLISYLFILSMLMFFIDYRATKRFMDEIQRSVEQKRLLKSELDRSESEIEYQKAMLFQQSKLAAMGEMIDNIAHQWRQPLNTLGVIVQDSQYAYRSGKLDQHYLQSMTTESMEQIEFMSQTIEDFRNFVKPDQKNTPFGLNESVQQSVQLLSGMLESHHIAINVEYSERELDVYGSTGEFKQVIINLLHNARDALIEKNPHNPAILIRILGDDTYGAVTIQDNGGGIAPEVIERIFEPYFTTKEEGKGSGIGLYMSYAIIRTKMGGMIEVSNVENGTLFTLTLPLWKDPFSLIEE